MHLWGTTSQQVNQRRVEGHDGVPHVYHLLLVVTISRPTGGKSKDMKRQERGQQFLKGITAKRQRRWGDKQLILRVSRH